jgi:DNA-binding LacI/PurR family transcriptional regulator
VLDTIHEDLQGTGQSLADLLIRLINGEPVQNLQTVRQPINRFRTALQR